MLWQSMKQKKPRYVKEIEHMEVAVADLKACRKATPRHVQFSDLPEEDRFRMLGMKSKHFIDTIKTHRLPGRDCHDQYRASDHAPPG